MGRRKAPMDLARDLTDAKALTTLIVTTAYVVQGRSGWEAEESYEPPYRVLGFTNTMFSIGGP